jgi:hypothetical protein
MHQTSETLFSIPPDPTSPPAPPLPPLAPACVCCLDSVVLAPVFGSRRGAWLAATLSDTHAIDWHQGSRR